MTDLTRCDRCGAFIVNAHELDGHEVTLDAKTVTAMGYHIESGSVRFCNLPHLHHRPHRCER